MPVYGVLSSHRCGDTFISGEIKPQQQQKPMSLMITIRLSRYLHTDITANNVLFNSKGQKKVKNVIKINTKK